MKYFTDIIGQNNIKSYLSFQLEGYSASKFFPPTLLTAKRGGGKTEIAHSLRKHLIGGDGKPRTFIEVNGASLKSPSGFVNKAVVPYQNKEVTYFIDECHAMDTSVKNFFLNVIDLNSERKSKTIFDGMDLEFDFTMQSFLFATTDPQKLAPAFKSRCKRVDLEPYSDKEMEAIVHFHAKKNNISLMDDVAEKIAKVARNTPREAVSLMNDIRQFCSIKKDSFFEEKDWEEMRKKLNIKPLGLSNSEILMLQLLQKYGELSLTNIANLMSLSKSTVMNDVEPFLAEMCLMKIDGKRNITSLGLQALNQLTK